MVLKTRRKIVFKWSQIVARPFWDHLNTICLPFFDHAIWEGPKPFFTISAKSHKCVFQGDSELIMENGQPAKEDMMRQEKAHRSALASLEVGVQLPPEIMTPKLPSQFQ